MLKITWQTVDICYNGNNKGDKLHKRRGRPKHNNKGKIMINRFTYLSDGELDAQLEELARQLDVDAMLSDEDDGELA